MKKRPSLKKSKKIKKIKPKKLLKRATYRGTAEARKLKQKWMDALQQLVGDISIDWNRAAMFYDQGMPVQAAFQKLIQRENNMSNTLKTQPEELVNVISGILSGTAYNEPEVEEEIDSEDSKPKTDKVDGRSKAVRAYKARVATRSQKQKVKRTTTKESNMDGYENTLDRIYNNLEKSL